MHLEIWKDHLFKEDTYVKNISFKIHLNKTFLHGDYKFIHLNKVLQKISTAQPSSSVAVYVLQLTKTVVPSKMFATLCLNVQYICHTYVQFNVHMPTIYVINVYLCQVMSQMYTYAISCHTCIHMLSYHTCIHNYAVMKYMYT